MDYIAAIFELLGLYVIGSKSKNGFLFNIIGNIIWVIVSFHSHLYGLLLVTIPAIFINIYNYRKWMYESKQKVGR